MKKLSIITILFFILGLINVNLSIVGLLCFITPFLLFYYYNDKVWCKKICPRAGLFLTLFQKVNFGYSIPKWITRKRMKRIVLLYFGINLFFALMSTLMVSLGRIQMFDNVRFLIVFNLPSLPQVIKYSISDVLTHFSYRIYSMMFTSTVIGIVLGLVYKPRTWCIICPISTLTTKHKGEKV